MLQVGTQERRPSDTVFTKVKNINNTHYAPPVVSTRSRCVQETACVYTCVHTRTRYGWHEIPLGAGFFQPGCSQYWQIQHTSHLAHSSEAAAAGSMLFLPLVKDLGVFSAARGAQVPVVRGLATAPSELVGWGVMPSQATSSLAGSPRCVLPARRAARDRGSV